MKNRIIAVILALAVLVGVFSFPKRARAAAAAVTIVSIGVLAWEILDIMIKGEEPAIIVGIREVLESGVDALTNPDSYFQQTYGDFWKDFGGGYEAVYNLALEMYENGEISISNGKVNLTYDQYKQFFGIAYDYVPNLGVEISTPNYYFAFSYTLGDYLYVRGLPYNDSFTSGQAYACALYDDNKIVFSDYYFVSKFYTSGRSNGAIRSLNDKFFIISDFRSYSNFSESNLEWWDPRFFYSSIATFVYKWRPSGKPQYELETLTYTSDYCFVFENGVMTHTPVSSVDLTGCKPVIVSTDADYGSFLQSITSVTTYEPVAGELDDLSTVLPVEESPVISFPANPDLSVPVADQVTVTTPTAANVPISDYLNPVITDIDTPSIILEKFPFCIPYDFIRIIGVLAADPIPPVFRIPISTHPANMEQWADNETIGDLVSPDDPMFDIDEEIVIDFAHIPLVQPICYTVFIVGFVIMLIKLTPKLIQH